MSIPNAVIKDNYYGKPKERFRNYRFKEQRDVFYYNRMWGRAWFWLGGGGGGGCLNLQIAQRVSGRLGR
jgi:hypothetical protein